MELQERIDAVEKKLNKINDYLDRIVAELGKIKAIKKKWLGDKDEN